MLFSMFAWHVEDHNLYRECDNTTRPGPIAASNPSPVLRQPWPCSAPTQAQPNPSPLQTRPLGHYFTTTALNSQPPWTHKKPMVLFVFNPECVRPIRCWSSLEIFMKLFKSENWVPTQAHWSPSLAQPSHRIPAASLAQPSQRWKYTERTKQKKK